MSRKKTPTAELLHTLLGETWTPDPRDGSYIALTDYTVGQCIADALIARNIHFGNLGGSGVYFQLSKEAIDMLAALSKAERLKLVQETGANKRNVAD